MAEKDNKRHHDENKDNEADNKEEVPLKLPKLYAQPHNENSHQRHIEEQLFLPQLYAQPGDDNSEALNTQPDDDDDDSDDSEESYVEHAELSEDQRQEHPIEFPPRYNGDDLHAAYVVKVTNLPHNLTEKELRKFFEPVRVVALTLHKKGCAFVSFDEIEDMEWALNLFEPVFKGRKLKITWANSKRYPAYTPRGAISFSIPCDGPAETAETAETPETAETAETVQTTETTEEAQD